MALNKSKFRKTRFRRAVVWGLFALAGGALAVGFSSPKIDRYAPFPGGLSGSGTYDVIGIAGQGAGGLSASGPYTLIGGFQAAPARAANAAEGWPAYR